MCGRWTLLGSYTHHDLLQKITVCAIIYSVHVQCQQDRRLRVYILEEDVDCMIAHSRAAGTWGPEQFNGIALTNSPTFPQELFPCLAEATMPTELVLLLLFPLLYIQLGDIILPSPSPLPFPLYPTRNARDLRSQQRSGIYRK